LETIMGDTQPQPSLKDHTRAIRHLDALRAEQLVTFFARSAVVDDRGLSYDHQDPIADTAKGCLTLERAAGDEVSDTATVGSYQTHLDLNGLTRLPLSVARKLARHRGHLYLEKLVSVTDSVAAALGDHRGGGLSLCSVRAASWRSESQWPCQAFGPGCIAPRETPWQASWPRSPGQYSRSRASTH
jgi:hypothetical protein